LKDRYGLSWQIVPVQLVERLTGGKGQQVMQALMTMKKLDLGALERAAT
jgi:predicted 3-demethylubiquinone-9 3-methyltransferase (glyoxalase superfamily)